MALKIDPGSERVRACRLAAQELCKKYGSANQAALKTGLRQQSISALLKSNQLGLEFADKLAAHYETTIDGLVWLFLREGNGDVRAGSVPGWSRAVEEAKAQWGDGGYDLAAQIVLPQAPRQATPRFAYDLAQIFHVHVKSSSIRAAVRKVGN